MSHHPTTPEPADEQALLYAKVRLVMLEIERRRLEGQIPMHDDVTTCRMERISEELGVRVCRHTLNRIALRALAKLRHCPEILAIKPQS